MRGKKLLSLVLSLVLAVSMIGAVPAKAATSYSGVLTADGAGSGDATCLYITGTDGYTPAGDGWSDTYKLTATEGDNGLWVGAIKDADAYLKKCDPSSGSYYVGGFDAVEVGEFITIKGTFQSADGAATITFEEASFLWTGEKWVDCYSGYLTKTGAEVVDTAASFYIKGTDAYKTAYEKNGEWEETTMMPADGDTSSGVFVDGDRVDNYYYAMDDDVDTTESYLRLRKYSDSSNAYYIERIPNVSENSVVTIKGVFYVYSNYKETGMYDATPIVFSESRFLWDGSSWTDEYVDYEGELSCSTNGGDTTYVHLNTTDTMASTSWSTELKALTSLSAWSDSGIYVNGTKATGAYLKKISTTEYYVGGFEVSEGDVLTIKGRFGVSDSRETVNFSRTLFQWDESSWSKVEPYEGKLTVAGSADSNFTNAAAIYLKGTDNYLSTDSSGNWDQAAAILYTDSFDTDSGIYLNGTRQIGETVRLKKWLGTSNYYYAEGFNAATAEGDTVTIKGTFYSSDGKAAVTFEESKFEWNGSCWVDYVPVYQGVLSYGDGANSSNSTAVYLETTDEMDVDSWDYAFYGKDRASGDSAEHGIWLDGTYQTGAQMKKVGGRYYVESFGTAQTNSILTIQGTFVSDKYTAAKVSFTKAQFQWNGSTWSNYIEKQTYDGTLTVSGAETTACNNDRIYLSGTDAYTYETTNENLQDWDNHKFTGKVTVGDSTIEVTLIKYSSANNWYYIGGLSGVEKGSVLTIGGDFVKTDNTVVITFEQSQFTWDGSNWKDYVYVETKYYEGTPKLYSAVNGEFGSASGFYFQSEDGAPCDDTWTDKWTACDGDDNGVFINGTKYNIPLKKFGTNNWYVAIIDCEEKNSVVAGDVVTIKGQICFENNIVTFAEKTFTFTGTHFQEGTFTTSGVTLTGLRYSQISYDESAGLWKMYFTSDSDIPGDVGTIYPFVEYSINGTSYTANAVKTLYTESEETKYALYIPMQELPQSLEQEYGIIIKECTSQGRYADTTYAREDGISLAEYIFTVGTGFGPSAPTIDTATASGGDANGIFLASGDDFPNLGWECALTQVGNTGITVDYDGDGTYEDSNYYMKKVGVSTYYLSMTDGGHSEAKQGTVVMLKGSYTYQTLYTATFKTVKYVYKDGQWEVYKATITETTSSVIGDAIGDEEITNSQDLVRVKRFLASEADTIDMAADLNSSGNIDTYDAGLLRWLLVNGADNNYVNGSRISGVPTYTNEDDYMRLAAYVTPTDEDGMASYKAAGLTTLISEYHASYESDDFATYMQYATDAKLDVLVESSQIRTMGEGGDVNQTVIREIHDKLKEYDSFRGYYLGDEPNISELETYTQVVNTLKTADPDVELFMAGWPTYVEDETALSTDTSLDLNEKYAAYATSWGNLLGEFGADFYPFQYTESILSWIGFEGDNTLRDDWFLNLELVAASGKGSYTTGITVQSHEGADTDSKTYYRTTGYEDISFQVYSALAYGAKYINYFTYGKHWEDDTMTKCMANDSTIYNAVKNVNEEIAAIDHILLNFNWQGTIGKAVDNDDLIMDNVNMNGYSSSRIKEWTTATNDTIIGCLKDVNAYDGFMIVNATDPIDGKESIVSVTFNNATNAKVYVKGVEVTASNYITVDEANKTITFNATLTHGQGIFVIPYME